MFQDVRIVVIGGDLRQVEVVRELLKEGAQVNVFGMEKALGLLPAEVLKTWSSSDMNEVMSNCDVLLLPALSCDEYDRISGGLTDHYFELDDHFMDAILEKTLIFTGVAHERFRSRCTARGLHLIELFDRDDVAIYNSIPTAEGAVMMAIKETDRTIHQSNCMVLGMGRTGTTLARLLKAMGANVSIGVHRPEQMARAYEMGFDAFNTADLEEKMEGIHLLFNTIPSMIVTAQVIVRMSLDTVLIDLASKPGGIDFRYAEKHGVKAILAPGLPGLVAPRTAGEIIAGCVKQFLVSHMKGSVTA